MIDYDDGSQTVPDYTMNIVKSYEEELDKMPQDLADALREMEQKFPEYEEYLYLKKGQIGVSISDGSLAFSDLCYPGEKLMWFEGRGESGIRRLDMGDGWELQMYYAPKG